MFDVTKDHLIIRSDDKMGFKLYSLEDWDDSALKSETVFEGNVSFLSVIPETNYLILANPNHGTHLLKLKLGESDESDEKINDYFLITPDNYNEINFINMQTKTTLFKC